MKKRKFRNVLNSLFALATPLFLFCQSSFIYAKEGEPVLISDIVGMYVHEGYPYNHPYSSRTWTVEDWMGYADGLQRLGYNTIMIWPQLETIPDPLLPTDVEILEKHATVIERLHRELGMRVMIVLCPNIAANASARRSKFEDRKFYRSYRLVDPANGSELTQMMVWREKLLRYLEGADAVVIIDSDPGGYPNATNSEFLELLKAHREMLDRLRPGIELDYWLWLGWQASGFFHATGVVRAATEAEFVDTLTRLKKADPSPWGVATDLADRDRFRYLEQTDLLSRAVSLNYNVIEGEPTLPLTNFGGHGAYEAGSRAGRRGVMGNAQTHSAQLPNTFAFARGARGRPLTEADYVEFAEGLILGHGRLIVDSWKALSATDPAIMRKQAAALERAASDSLRTGTFRGLLFGDARRFMIDLVFQLKLKASLQDFMAAQKMGQPAWSRL